MSIFNQIAQGSNIGAGINAFAQNRYMVQQDQKAEAERQQQNAFAMQQNQAETMRQIFMDAVQLGPEAGYAYTVDMAKRFNLPMPTEDYRGILAKASEQMIPQGAQQPASLQEWQAWQRMSPQEREQFLLIKRAAPVVQTGGGGVAFASPVTNSVTPVVSAEGATAADAANAGAVRAAQEGATIAAIPERVETETRARVGAIPQIAQAEREAQGQGELGGALEKANQAVVTLTALRDHPGTPYLVGASSYLPVIAGSDAAGAKAYLDQVTGQAFLQAFESLKGGGQITQIEGEKATAAIGRLSTAQKEGEFKAALNELIGIAMRASDRAKKKAGEDVKVQGVKSMQEPAITIGTVEDGYRFNGGDPADPANWTKEQ